MPEPAELERMLAEIVAEGGTTAPRRICEACISVLKVSRAAVTMMAGPDRQEPIFASDSVAAHLDEMQFRLGEGPCVEAFTERRPVLIPDLAELTGSRWPVFAAAARRTPVRAAFVLPLQAGAIGVGVLDLYRDEPGMLDHDELAGALRAADAVLWALLGIRAGKATELPAPATQPHNGADPHGWLTGSPLDHIEVYQATGMIMVQLDVSAETALSRLRAYAFVHERSIDDIARDVVARRLRFGTEEEES
ncbi:GAF and ANTAR domain-containing protein [Pseudonocardia cypriaca]|uniref:GAF and ANTAR domain-containing protein n=1 Tax=Pseudonocardia cypriaca TaxID=882449 RepID=UPI0011526AFE|nr:GAF and ANTAR domain-containing protein [Pseudonocardia cypriaca]